MKALSLIVLIPFAAFAGHPSCEELQSYASKLENAVKSHHASECREMDLKQMLSVETTPATTKWFNDLKCGRLSAIETELAKLENQLTMLKGIEYLKQAIRDNKITVKQSQGSRAQEAGKKFVDALNTAQSLESLLSLPDPLNSFTQLQNIPYEERDTPEKFKAKMRQICSKLKVTSGVCAKGHKFSESAVRDINALLRQNVSEDNGALLSSWADALRIVKQDGSEYSFEQMSQDFEGFEVLPDQKIDLTREQLQKISSLPDFQNAPPGLAFLNQLKGIGQSQDVQISHQFKFLVEDLKQRQELEVMSKLSATVQEFQKDMSEGQKNACNNMHVSNATAAPACLNALKELKKASIGTNEAEKRAHLSLMIDILQPAVDYHDELGSIIQECLNGELTPECLGKVNLGMTEIAQRTEALSALKNKIIEENESKMILREFALYKWKEDCEVDAYASVIEQCETVTEQIAPEVISLTDHISQITMTYIPKENSQDEDNARALCETENWSKGLQLDKDVQRLCNFFQPDQEYSPPVVDRSGDSVDVGLSPEGRNNAVKDAWIRGLSNLSHTLANALNPRPPYAQGVNPYYFANNPYNSGFGLMSPSDKLLYQASYYGGYGKYFSTPGTTPFTSFPTAVTPYASLGVARSPYFTGK